MSALPEALPLAVAAALYPPALLVLLLFTTGTRPRRLVATYLAGAATVTLAAGLIGLELLGAADLTTQDSHTASGTLDIVVGLALLIAAAWAWRRPARDPAVRATRSDAAGGRIADWSQRALASHRWAFALGLAMFLPSPLYLLAVKEIADSGDPPASQALAVVICATAVMLFVEIPLVAMLVWPAGVAAALERVYGWLSRNGWTLAAAAALAGGLYAILKGLDQLA